MDLLKISIKVWIPLAIFVTVMIVLIIMSSNKFFAGADRFNSKTSKVVDKFYMDYDGKEIKGVDLVSLINIDNTKHKVDNITVLVKTGATVTAYGSTSSSISSDITWSQGWAVNSTFVTSSTTKYTSLTKKTDANYINKNIMFKCQLGFDTNGSLVYMWFEEA